MTATVERIEKVDLSKKSNGQLIKWRNGKDLTTRQFLAICSSDKAIAAFTFLFAANRSGVFLTVFTPNRRRLDMQIAPAGTRLRSPLLEQHHGAFAVLIVPGFEQSFEPIPIGLYGLHQLGTAPHPVLTQLDKRRISLKDLEAALVRYEFYPASGV